MGSAISSCLRNRVKLGTNRATENRKIRDPGETWIILSAMTVNRKSTMIVTVSATLRPRLNGMHNRSVIWNRVNLPTIPLVE